ncbi:CBD9-like protein [Obba rivulosa]|uniref:CBD9-like protein n=1 Tax=Obba rivulosa TaxID=1052685 RepID=A0A8E2AST8_9APHY|nr:CBD9-like protein [Obba rivulosa]
MRPTLALPLLGLCTLALADRRGRGGGDDNDGDDNSSSVGPSASGSLAPSPSSSASSNSTSSSSGNSTLTGDTVCTGLMCITGVVNGSTTEYTLQSQDAATLGWMAMGFGTQMADSPMVIMWGNSDGSITISQRQAPAEVMPTLVSNPPRVATPMPSLSSLTGSNPKFVYTIATNTTGETDIIWAFGNVNPDNSAQDATLQQHLSSGPTSLDLSKSLSPSSGGNSTNSATPTVPAGSASIPLLPYQKYIVAHAILCVVGFLGFLPLGAILARWARTFTSVWFQGHWVVQFLFALPVIVAGVALGIAAVAKEGVPHVDDDHKRWGIALFVLYFVQITLGAVVHSIKPSSWTVERKRPLQNYFHALLGLLIIGIAFYQVRTGFRTEWVTATGRTPIPNAANIVWIVWVVLIPVLYFGGLAFLPRQFKQEHYAKPEPVPSTDADADRY